MILVHRLTAAFSTIPDLEAWAWTALLLCLFTIISLAVGFKFNFLQVKVETASSTVVSVIPMTLLIPGLLEETVFRVLLLPHPAENPSIQVQLLWGLGSLAIFIISHPLNGLTFYPARLKTFTNPVFLSLAGLLGLVCTLAYWQSGSIWTPIAIHWLIVVIWLLGLGGYQKLSQ